MVLHHSEPNAPSNEAMTMESDRLGCEKPVDGGINHFDSTPHASDIAANQAGSFFSPLPMATTFDQQLAKMKSRGLIVDDEDIALSRLHDFNYYRLRGYWLTLEEDDSFIGHASFDDIWEIYKLDQELRRWLWQAIAPIEIKLRTQFAYQFANYCGPDAYLDVSNYLRRDNFNRALANYERERDRAYSQGVPFVVHNMDKYGILPVWAAVEIMSFGTLSMLYGNLKLAPWDGEDGLGLAESMASAFGTKQRYLKSWAHHLTTVRNIAAHHDRFYNRMMNIRPLLLQRDRRYASNKEFPTFLIIKRIYEKSWPSEWKTLGEELEKCFARHSGVSLAPMGFPDNWKNVLNLPCSGQ